MEDWNPRGLTTYNEGLVVVGGLTVTDKQRKQEKGRREEEQTVSLERDRPLWWCSVASVA